MKIALLVLLLTMTACGAGTYKLQEENDYFTLFNSDHDYTQGLMLSHQNEEREATIGQRIYTPIHKKLSEAPSNERPYAGYLFTRWDFYQPVVGENHPYLGFEAGIIGPPSLGKEAQCGVHSALGQACPQGWHDQLHTEPGLTLRAGNRIVRPASFLFTNGDVEYRVLAEVGNVSTALIGGTTLTYRVVPWASFFAGPDVHLVARDILLDGNTWRDSASIHKNWYYTEMTGGFKIDLPYLPAIMWYIRIQSKQYEGQPTAYNYGGVEISWQN